MCPKYVNPKGLTATCYHCKTTWNYRGNPMAKRMSCPFCHNSLSMQVMLMRAIYADDEFALTRIGWILSWNHKECITHVQADKDDLYEP